MLFKKNVGKQERILRVVLGSIFLGLMIPTGGWLRFGAGVVGLSLILTAFLSF